MPGCGTAMTSLDGRDLIGRGTACKQDRPLIEMFARPRERALHFLRSVDEAVGSRLRIGIACSARSIW